MRFGRRGAAGAAVAAAGLVAVLGWQLAASPACAAAAGQQATWFTPAGPQGNCGFPEWAEGGLYAALGPAEYRNGEACGSYLDVTGPRGTVRVKVADQCPECGPGHVDLGRGAFAKIHDPADGLVDVTYKRVVNPAGYGRLAFRIQEEASQYWFSMLVDDHGNTITDVEVKARGAWVRPQRADYNYWLVDGGLGPGPFTVRVTDDQGHRATAEGIRLRPGVYQRTSARLYGSGAAAPRATARATPKPTPPPSPSPKATPSTPPPVTPTATPDAVSTVLARPAVALEESAAEATKGCA